MVCICICTYLTDAGKPPHRGSRGGWGRMAGQVRGLRGQAQPSQGKGGTWGWDREGRGSGRGGACAASCFSRAFSWASIAMMGGVDSSDTFSLPFMMMLMLPLPLPLALPLPLPLSPPAPPSLLRHHSSRRARRPVAKTMAIRSLMIKSHNNARSPA